jgi:hypothetical protein
MIRIFLLSVYILLLCIVFVFNAQLLRYILTIAHNSYIQGVPGGMCQTSGGCSLC